MWLLFSLFLISWYRKMQEKTCNKHEQGKSIFLYQIKKNYTEEYSELFQTKRVILHVWQGSEQTPESWRKFSIF